MTTMLKVLCAPSRRAGTRADLFKALKRDNIVELLVQHFETIQYECYDGCLYNTDKERSIP